jgi:hypothetical protein
MRRSGTRRNGRPQRISSPCTTVQSYTRRSGRSRCEFSPSSMACQTRISGGFVGCFGYPCRVSATGQKRAPEGRRRTVRHCLHFPTRQPVIDKDRNFLLGAPTLATPSQRYLDFLLRTLKRPKHQTTWWAVCQDVSGALQRQRNLSDECFIFSLRFAEAPMEIRQLVTLAVKSEAADCRHLARI